MKKTKSLLCLLFAFIIMTASSMSAYAADITQLTEPQDIVTAGYNPYSTEGQSRSITASKTQIDQITSLILSSYNGYHLTSNNCVKFAISAWNLCADSNNRISTSIFMPDGLVNAIEDLDVHFSGTSTSIPATITCGFYNGSTYIEHSLPNSLN